MDELRPELLTHAEQIHEFLQMNLSEADTRVYLIDPVLKLLGYIGVGDIRREVPVPATKEFMDYELYADGKAQAIVEAKALKHPVTDQASAQCVQYAAVLGVRWCIITNGVMWAVYNAHATGPLADKRVASVRLDGDEVSLHRAWEVLSLFSRESLGKANPLTALLAERVIMDELSRPDSAAIAALRKAVRDRFSERVTPQMIVETIARVWEWTRPPEHVWTTGRPTGDAASATEPSEIVVAPRITTSGERQRKERQDVLMPNGHRATLQDLLDAGLLPPDAVLESATRGATFVARLRGLEVDMNGATYENLSAAAEAALGSKRNGWMFWAYQGTLLGGLRKQLASSLAAETDVSAG
jgi:predicted type IV restriction endonuclease